MNGAQSGRGTLETVGIVHSCFPEKFGIPRQPGLVPSASAVIELIGDFNREEMIQGLEHFSHLWVLFQFHATVSEGWRPTVRPPRLGGRTRLGVFATRSPHRPNHLGISAVRLERISFAEDAWHLDVSGIDLLDGTPVLDLKPYIPYSDRVMEATAVLPEFDGGRMGIVFAPAAERFCREYRGRTGRNLQALIGEVLRADPRPASQRERRETFGMRLWEVNIRWSVDAGTSRITVSSCEAV